MTKNSKMRIAFNKEAEGIKTLARGLSREDGSFDSDKIKQLKDLTVAAKELASLMKITDSESEERSLCVEFEKEGEAWAE